MDEFQSKSIVGKQSPEFVADAIVQGEMQRINSLDFYGKYVLYFFYESDFSFVCPTEMFALQEALPEFKRKNVEIVGVSVDPIQAHAAWLKTPRSEGGIEGVEFMIVSDVHKILARAFCVLDEEHGSCLRGTFFVDRSGIVQYGAVNGYEIGRNIQDILRIIDAVQFTKNNNELCPMDWKLGDEAIKL